MFNRAVGIEWNFETSLPIANWTEFQRRAKHLIAVELELETIIDWILESMDQNTMKLVRVDPELLNEKVDVTDFTSFWDWDQDIDINGHVISQMRGSKE